MINLIRKKILLILIKFFIKLHIFLYNIINSLIVKSNNGVHPKHKITNYHQFFIQNIDKDSSVLDIGCGIGALSYDVAKKAKLVIGIDINKRFIEIASQKFKKDNITYIFDNAITYKFDNSFDYIILSNVLEHIKDRIKFLNKIKKLSRIILLRVPCLNRDWFTLFKKDLGLDYRLDQSHYIEYTVESLTKELNAAGLQLISYSIQFGEIWAIIKI